MTVLQDYVCLAVYKDIVAIHAKVRGKLFLVFFKRILQNFTQILFKLAHTDRISHITAIGDKVQNFHQKPNLLI